jgi:hypothetical protein
MRSVEAKVVENSQREVRDYALLVRRRRAHHHLAQEHALLPM